MFSIRFLSLQLAISLRIFLSIALRSLLRGNFEWGLERQVGEVGKLEVSDMLSCDDVAIEVTTTEKGRGVGDTVKSESSSLVEMIRFAVDSSMEVLDASISASYSIDSREGCDEVESMVLSEAEYCWGIVTAGV